MKLAAVSDIHGNLDALEAVLRDVARRGVDATVNLGDILSGPLRPRETADLLMSLRLPTISGNHERQLLASNRAMAASDRHAADAITAAQREWLISLPQTLQLDAEVFLCHATPSSDVDCFLEDIVDGEFVDAPFDRIALRAEPCAASLILCGHSHYPKVAFLPTGQTIVNPGSVGIQAYAGHHPVPHVFEMGAPHARYAIVENSAAGWSVQLLAVPYDWDGAARLAERNDRPDWALALRTGYVKDALR